MRHVITATTQRLEQTEEAFFFKSIKPNKPWNQKPKKSLGSFVEYVTTLFTTNRKVSKRLDKLKLEPKVDATTGRVVFEGKSSLFKKAHINSCMWSHTGELFVNVDNTTKILQAKTMEQLLTQLESITV